MNYFEWISDHCYLFKWVARVQRTLLQSILMEKCRNTVSRKKKLSSLLSSIVSSRSNGTTKYDEKKHRILLIENIHVVDPGYSIYADIICYVIA